MAMLHVPLHLTATWHHMVKTCGGRPPTDLLILVAFRVAHHRDQTTIHEVVRPNHSPYVPNVPVHARNLPTCAVRQIPLDSDEAHRKQLQHRARFSARVPVRQLALPTRPGTPHPNGRTMYKN